MKIFIFIPRLIKITEKGERTDFFATANSKSGYFVDLKVLLSYDDFLTQQWDFLFSPKHFCSSHSL